MSVLVFAPHPDDDLIGCGGSLVKHQMQGRRISIVYVTSGNAGSRAIAKADLGRIREAEAVAAMSHLGVTDLTFLRVDDGTVADTADLRMRIVEIVRQKRPQIVYLPHADDGHPDHRATNGVVLGAIGYAGGPWFQETSGDPWSVPTVLAYEVWTPVQRASYMEDITDVASDVAAALKCHASQVADVDYESLLFGLARFRGVSLGFGRLAEAFELLSAPVSGFTTGRMIDGQP